MWRKYRVSDKGYSSVLLGIGHYLSPGGGRGGGAKDLRLNKVKFSQSLPFKVTSLKRSPLITFDDFRAPPPPYVFIFQANFSGSPLWILPKFSAIPPFGFLATTDPPFFSPKNHVIPHKILPLPRQAINNDRSFSSHIRITVNRKSYCSSRISRGIWANQRQWNILNEYKAIIG